MFLYYLIAAVTTTTAYFAVKAELKSRFAAFLLYLLVIVAFSHFAGARDLSVGTDTSFYGILGYRDARVLPFIVYYFEGTFSSGFAELYKVILWTTANIFKNSYWYFFVTEALICTPVLVACRMLSRRCLPLGVFVFAIVFYPMSFNMMRQMIAMGFILIQYCFIRDKKRMLSIFALLVAFGFHHSAVIALLLYPLCHLGKLKGMSLGLKITVAALVFAVVLLFSRELLSIGASIFGQFGSYVSWGTAKAGGGLRVMLEIGTLAAAISILSVMVGVRVRNESSDIGRLVVLVLSGVALFSLCLVSLWFYRIGMYYLYFSILLIPVLARSINEKKYRLVFITIVCTLLFAFSLDYYMVTSQHEIYPYVFASNFEY